VKTTILVGKAAIDWQFFHSYVNFWMAMKMYIETKKGYKAGDPPSNFAGNHLVLPEALSKHRKYP
jgi:hypothetical protein